jgi:chemotaxis protein MotA
MNPSTLIGMVAGLAMMASVLFWSATDPSLFLNLPGLAIVVGGTLAATFISYPLGEVLRVFRLFGTVLRNEKL